ncbi:MAG TPA: amidase [Pseudomonadales bacterium]
MSAAAGVGYRAAACPRRAALLIALAAVGFDPAFAAPAAAPDAEAIAGLTAEELRARLERGELTAAAVTDAFLARIAELDDAGPRLNAIVDLNPDARRIAAELDRAFAEAGPQGPLHGLPVVLKANIDTGDRMPTHAGSLALADHRAPEDAHLVTRLRAAGAVVLGKANLSEWANFRGEHSTSGWSSVGGQTRNPYVLDRNPCGSSSGSAVAVAAGLAPLAVGTETDGSIVCPSAINGIVGIKPTVGTVSRHGIIPISHTQDTAGPMARTVADAALLLGVLVDHDPRDPAPRRFPAGTSFLPDPALTRLEGLRIGVNRSYFGAGEYPALERIYQAALDRLEALGAVLVDDVVPELPERLFDAELDVMLYEFKAGLNAYLASHPVPEDRNTLAELIVWNRAHADRVMPVFGQELFVRAEAKGGLDDAAYTRALADGPQRMQEILGRLLETERLDALVTLAGSFAWKTDWVAGDRYIAGSSSLAAMSGFPSISVPAGDVAGLPVGIAFVGEPFSEPRLIRIAYAFEQTTGWRRKPAFVPTLERPAR